MPGPRRTFSKFRPPKASAAQGAKVLKLRGFTVNFGSGKRLVRFSTLLDGTIITRSIRVQRKPRIGKTLVFERAEGGLLDDIIGQLLAKKLKRR